MSAKVMNKLEAEKNLMTEILEAVKKSGLSEEAVKTVLNRIVEVIDNEE